MSSTHRHSSGPRGEPVLAAVALVAGVTIALGWELGEHLAWALAGQRSHTWSPVELAADLLKGHVKPGPGALAICVALIVVLLAAVVAIVMLIRRAGWVGDGRPDRYPDRAARLMGTRRQLQTMTAKSMRKTAERFNLTEPGLPLGRSVMTGQVLFSDWEAVSTVIAGMRRMKTSGIGIPLVLRAPGAVLATSNKPDIHAATRLQRDERGPVFVLDPQRIASQPASWWWNPLSYVTSGRRARELTAAFADAYVDRNARTDGFFEPKGIALTADLIHAAALDGRPITDCYLWATDPRNDEPALILADHGEDLAAKSVRSNVQAPNDQREGVAASAQKTLQFLADRDAAQWVTPNGADDPRPQLNVEEFVRSTGTLYMLSKEGPGSAAGIVTALTMAICEAAEDYAASSPGGRLPVPMVCVLDEAANVCPWEQLPNLYTHYGSRGILLTTLLQGWNQGVAVWGEAGMHKLWSAANYKVFGGGVTEEPFLRVLESLIGDYNRLTVSPTSSSSGRGPDGRSVSVQGTPTSIMTVADLSALPRERAIVFGSGTPPAMTRPLYWFEDKGLKPDIERSLELHDPARARAALTRAERRTERPSTATSTSTAPTGDRQWPSRATLAAARPDDEGASRELAASDTAAAPEAATNPWAGL